VRATAERVGLPLDLTQAGQLAMPSSGDWNRRGPASNARVLLLDEPTAVLAPGEAEELRVVRLPTRAGRRS
jgi:hypothetical protein